MNIMTRLARLAAVALLASGSFAIAVHDADARAGKGGSSGSRGSQTYQAPPSTNTSPGTAAPINRSITQPGQAARPAAGQASQATGAAQQASRFGGMRGLLLGGLIGAGLATFLGAGTLASVLGFILQMLLIAGIVFLAIAAFRALRGGGRGAAPAVATAGAGPAPTPVQQQMGNHRATAAGLGGAAAGVTVGEADYNAFERLLGEVQTAYGRNDIDALGERVTPEMLSYFAGELDENAKKGLINEIGAVKLLQGDLAEAWREGTVEYATVAMRYAITDAVVEARTGRVVSGSKTEPQEVTEVWTFRRPSGSAAERWELSAIQQTA
jgi:predicted lipid-binding transport protein (Tim44 family)